MRILPLFVLVYCCNAGAQDSTVVIKAGMSVNESVSMKDLYEYPQFAPGKVFFRPGHSSAGMLNYNRLLDEMQFIDIKGDTLNLSDPGTIKSIRINSDLFYFDDGYVKLVRDHNTIKLASKQTLRVADKEKTGAYNMPSSTSAINSYGTYITDRKMYDLVPREDIVLKRVTQYYFGDKYNRFVLANKKNLLRLFSKQNGTVNAYLKENNVDFSNQEDLEKLVQYLSSL